MPRFKAVAACSMIWPTRPHPSSRRLLAVAAAAFLHDHAAVPFMLVAHVQRHIRTPDVVVRRGDVGPVAQGSDKCRVNVTNTLVPCDRCAIGDETKGSIAHRSREDGRGRSGEVKPRTPESGKMHPSPPAPDPPDPTARRREIDHSIDLVRSQVTPRRGDHQALDRTENLMHSGNGYISRVAQQFDCDGIRLIVDVDI